MKMLLYIAKCIILLFVIEIPAASGEYETEYDENDFQMMVMPRQGEADTLNLPSNATSIRENITDTFSCEDRTYGYYADVDNDCQIFHVCQQVTYADGRNETFRWSFICPNGTVFNQEVFTCVRPEDSIDCEDSPMYYNLNDDLGKSDNDSKKDEDTSNKNNDDGKAKEKPGKYQDVNTLDDAPDDAPFFQPQNLQVISAPDDSSNRLQGKPHKPDENGGGTDENKTPTAADNRDSGSWITGPRSSHPQRRRHRGM